MKKIICYLRTFKDWKIFLQAFWNFNAIYIAHDYYEQKSYIRGKKMYFPVKCKTCGDISIGWRKF